MITAWFAEWEGIRAFFAGHTLLLWLVAVQLDLLLVLSLYRMFGKMGLYGVIVLDTLLCNIFGPKLTQILGMNTSLGAIIYSGIYFATDMLGERYGRREANRAVLIGFGAAVGVVLMTQLSLVFPPTPRPENAAALAERAHDAQAMLFGMTPRFVFGSLLAYLLSQSHDVWMFHLLKRWTRGRHLWLRNNLSTMISQAIDTVVYAAVVWSGILGWQQAIELCLAKYFFKVLIALMDTPYLYWARTWDLRHRDWSDMADPDPLARERA